MRNLKRFWTLLLSLALVLSLCAPAYAAVEDTGFSDVEPDAWYAEFVVYCRDNGLFGTDDPIAREQMAVMLWRYSGSPSANAGSDFADESSIASWADTAVDWAGENGYMGGVGANLFQPQGQSTCAQMATILTRYHQDAETQVPPEPEPESEPEVAQILVAHFSATGNTENIAQHIQTILNADLYEIVPKDPYTSEDLNYSNDDCRANQEQNDPNACPAISGSVEHMEDYDVMFLGYPIWWGQAPKIIHTFLESYDLDGVTIVPFCTSGSSDIGSSATNLQSLAPNANWLSGQRFSGSASESAVASWVEGLELPSGAGGTVQTTAAPE